MGENTFMMSEVKSIWNKPKQRLFRIRMMLRHHLRTRYGLLRRAIRRATEEGLAVRDERGAYVKPINA